MERPDKFSIHVTESGEETPSPSKVSKVKSLCSNESNTEFLNNMSWTFNSFSLSEENLEQKKSTIKYKYILFNSL